MSETTLQAAPPAPLTTLTEDEILFRDNIRQFADEKIRSSRERNGREGRDTITISSTISFSST